jgi:hypothetical protein
VVKIAERQPSLLLQEDVDWDSTESLAQRLAAWEFGLVSDSDPEWRKRWALLLVNAAGGRRFGGWCWGADPEWRQW